MDAKEQAIEILRMTDEWLADTETNSSHSFSAQDKRDLVGHIAAELEAEYAAGKRDGQVIGYMTRDAETAMPSLPFTCGRCGVQQHANGICANCGAVVEARPHDEVSAALAELRELVSTDVTIIKTNGSTVEGEWLLYGVHISGHPECDKITGKTLLEVVRKVREWQSQQSGEEGMNA